MSEKITRDELDLYIARLDPKDFNATTLMVTKMVDYINSMELEVKDAEWRLNLALTQLEELNKTHNFEMECYRQCEEQLKACETALEEAQLHSSYEFACVEEFKEQVKFLENKMKKLQSKIKKEKEPLEDLIEPEKEFFITFTGIDSHTELSKLSKNAEYGILFSTKNDSNRYPSQDTIFTMADYLYNEGHQLSLHICGSGAKELLLNKELEHMINYFKRIQVNGKVKLQKAISICNLYPNHSIIFQYNEDNKNLIEELKEIENVSFLVDASGGKGLSPTEWINPDFDSYIGYAGGLGEDNIINQLNDIYEVASNYFWIDMESKLRDENDLFSIKKANKILKLILGE